ncbi:MAG: NADP-dependent isocitrate dehydrogenase [Fibromonadaceae bacterium]|jgi:isocitrate dehydrogenase|nr:NADP-dependent isocitrate dehydrogenase [Fibromonadaceae bacterium]
MIIYTLTDESPRLATESLLPIAKFFANAAGIEIETRDISLAARILAAFDFAPDDLAHLSKLTQEPSANIIKLPNISASIPQLKAAIAELQGKGYKIPNYPEKPQNSDEQKIKDAYDKVKGSAVNPVLRQGNSDRRAPLAVKQYAKKHPHSMGEWKNDFKTDVASMQSGDFYESEKSITLKENTSFSIEFINEKSEKTTLKKSAPLLAGEILDSSVLKIKELESFFEREYEQAKKDDMTVSVHLKATMMKVSDPVIFGVAFKTLFKSLFNKFSKEFAELGIDPNNGLQDLRKKIAGSPKEAEIENEIQNTLKNAPRLAMDFNSPSDIIVDASMPALIRRAPQDELALIPDRSYAGIYSAAIDFCKKNGAFSPATMGSIPNVGLMAESAEEYGSHDKTFIAKEKGIMQAVDGNGQVLLKQEVEEGDIYRMCQTKDIPTRNWVHLAAERAKLTQSPVVFWLDPNRAHDREVEKKVKDELSKIDLSGLDISVKNPIEATLFSMQRAKEGLDTISATGNVLRDYLTDLFPILELGTSAKMLSIVPLLAGGGIFETGAGGSAPKQVEQLLKENYLRWDSLGEFFALAESISFYAKQTGNKKAEILAKTLDLANGSILEFNRVPARKLGELDNRGSHFYLALYWATELAKQNEDLDLKNKFEPFAKYLSDNEQKIVAELASAQGHAVDIGGYYLPDADKLAKVMRLRLADADKFKTDLF